MLRRMVLMIVLISLSELGLVSSFPIPSMIVRRVQSEMNLNQIHHFYHRQSDADSQNSTIRPSSSTSNSSISSNTPAPSATPPNLMTPFGFVFATTRYPSGLAGAPLLKTAVVLTNMSSAELTSVAYVILPFMINVLRQQGHVKTYDLVVDYYSGPSPQIYAKIAIHISANNYSVVIGPNTIESTTTYEDLLYVFGVPMIGYFSGDPKLTASTTRYDNYVRVNPSQKDLVPGYIQLIRQYGWKKVIFFGMADGTGLMTSLTFSSAAAEHGIRVSDTILLNDVTAKDFEIALLKIKQGRTRVIVTQFDTSYLLMLSIAEKLGMLTSEYVWLHSDVTANGVLDSIANARGMRQQLLGWLDGSLAIAGSTSSGQKGFSFFKALEGFFASFGVNVSFTNPKNSIPADLAYFVAGVSYFQDALETMMQVGNTLAEKKQNMTDLTAVRSAISQTFFSGVTGEVSFERNGARKGSILRWANLVASEGQLTVGLSNNSSVEILQSPMWRNTSTVPLDSVPPAPEYISLPLIVCFFIAAAVLTIAYVVTFILISKKRGILVVQQSGYFYLTMMIVGAIVMVSSVYVIGIDMKYVSREMRDRLCNLYVWMIGIGFMLLFGSLFSKSWRIWWIVQLPDIKSASRVDKKMFAFLGASLAGEIILLILWTVFDPIKVVSKVSADEMTVFYICESKSYGFPVAWIMYNELFLFAGVIVALFTRNLEKRFNESKVIGFSIYNVFILTAIIVPLCFVLNDNPDIVFVLKAIGVIGIPVGATVILFGNQLVVIFQCIKSSSSSTIPQPSIYEAPSKKSQSVK